MSDRAFDRTILNPLERPLSSDVNQLLSTADYSLREVLARLSSSRVGPTSDVGATPSGFWGDGLMVRPEAPAGLFVRVMPGLGFQTNVADVPTNLNGAVHVDDRNAYKPLPLLSTATIAVPASDPVNPRIDLVEVRYDRKLEGVSTRDVLNIVTGAFDPTVLNKQLSFLLDGLTSVNGVSPINYKTGVPAGVPVAPATSAGYTPIAYVLRPALSVTVLENQITDLRFLLSPTSGFRAQARVQTNGVAITGITVSGPPGIRIGAGVGTAFAAGARVDLAVVLPGVGAGALTHFARLSRGIYQGATANAMFDELPASASAVFDVTGPLQALLATYTPALNVAIGARYINTSCQIRQFTGGAFTYDLTAGGNAPTTNEYYFDVDVRL